MEIAILLSGAFLGGCVAAIILGCIQLYQSECYENEIEKLKEKLNNR